MTNEAIKLNGVPVIGGAQAKKDLNSTMLKLKNQYGFAPAKDITLEEMQQRCEDVVEAADKALEAYVSATGQTPDRMRNTSFYKASKDFPAKKYEGLQAHANVPDAQLRKAPLHMQEGVGNLLAFNAEYLLKAAHREEIANRTRKEWARLEYEYVERSDYNLRDLHHELLESISVIEDYTTERKKWRKCKCYSCDNYFPISKDHFKARSKYWKYKNIETGRSNSQYCSKSCRKTQENAVERFKRTGTYLPETEYRYVLDDFKERQEKKHITFDPSILTIISDKHQ